MTCLTSITSVLRAVTTTASALAVSVLYTDFGAASATPGPQDTAIASATTSVICAAPAVSVQRLIKGVSCTNTGAASQVVTVQRYDGAVATELARATLLPGEALRYGAEVWGVFDAQGRPKAALGATGAGRAIGFMKSGTTKEAAGVWHCNYAAAGYPGAWTPGAPGLNGRVTDGMVAADIGCLPLWSATGALYLTAMDVTSSVAQVVAQMDVLWLNSGLVVTTTTAQAFASVALPARDQDGGTVGRGCMVGLLVTGATTNAAAITNATVSYTNSAGVAGRVGSMASFPATAVAGSFIPFMLQAGDEGVRSVESVTLGTSLVTGSVSAAIVRPIVQAGVVLANTSFQARPAGDAGVRIYPGSCLLEFELSTTTTAAMTSGVATVVER